VEVDALLADLPAPASAFPAVGEVVGERTSGQSAACFGGIKLSGDLRLRSLTPGESPSRWRAVLDRLADRRPPPPLPPPPVPPRS
jgi:hypothetical protein